MNDHGMTLEQRLERALAPDPQARTLAVLDERVGQAIIRAPQGHASRWGMRKARHSTRPGLAFALLVGLAGAAVAGTGILDRLADSSPAFAVAWERATRIHQTRSSDDRAITVERVYVDANQILVGMTARDRSGEVADLGRVELRIDGVGQARGLIGGGDTSGFETAEVLTFATPVGMGDEVPITLTSSSPPATFRFSVPNSGGRTVAPDAQADAAGVSVTLRRLTVSPTAISGDLAFVGSPIETGEAWSPVGWIGFGETRSNIAIVQPATDDGRVVTVRTVVGHEDPVGTWTVRIDEIVGHRNGEQIRLTGPWVFEVTIN